MENNEQREEQHEIPYLSANPADANWTQINNGMLQADRVTPTEKWRKFKEEMERYKREHPERDEL